MQLSVSTTARPAQLHTHITAQRSAAQRSAAHNTTQHNTTHALTVWRDRRHGFVAKELVHWDDQAPRVAPPRTQLDTVAKDLARCKVRRAVRHRERRAPRFSSVFAAQQEHRPSAVRARRPVQEGVEEGVVERRVHEATATVHILRCSPWVLHEHHSLAERLAIIRRALELARSWGCVQW